MDSASADKSDEPLVENVSETGAGTEWSQPPDGAPKKDEESAAPSAGIEVSEKLQNEGGHVEQPSMARNASAGDTQPSLPVGAPDVEDSAPTDAPANPNSSPPSPPADLATETKDKDDTVTADPESENVAATQPSEGTEAPSQDAEPAPEVSGNDESSKPQATTDTTKSDSIHVPDASTLNKEEQLEDKPSASGSTTEPSPMDVEQPEESVNEKQTVDMPKENEKPTATESDTADPAMPSAEAGDSTGPTTMPSYKPPEPETSWIGESKRAAMAASENPPGSGQYDNGGFKELRVEDALLYLDDVKREFGHNPRVYNEFLLIMKNFKSQVVDTPGVITRVTRLFRGYDKLILGFNKFLPDGCKITPEDLEKQEAEYKRMEEDRERRLREAREAAAKRKGSPLSAEPQSKQSKVDEGAAAAGLKPPPPTQKTAPGALQNRPPPQRSPAQQQPPQQHQAVEFDHAISYVTTIKRRFANDPSTYHSFLEILHTYQKEQRGIKDVLEQVAHLFQDHPDLLKEFTFFLPDAVQEQAKERLHRAAAESEERIARRGQGQQGDAESQRFIDMTGRGSSDQQRGRKRAHKDSKHGMAVQQETHVPIQVPVPPEMYVYNSAVERQFFDAAREALAMHTRDGGQAWAEFLKCLDMYAQEILSRSEMLNFVEPLLGKRNTKLFEEFKRILGAAGVAAANNISNMEDSWHSVPLSEIDFSRCRRCSPSYRALPRDYPAPPCSERSEMEAKVLNNIWVSLPVGSEESYSFRHMRKNTYEEILFRVEDERFEIDMVIDSNATTLARLEPIAEEIAQLAQEELKIDEITQNVKTASDSFGMGGRKFEYRFDKSILGVIHRNSIARIYGDAGQEMLDLMVKNPTVAIPVVVKRLQQKDKEWRAVRNRMNRTWKDLAEHNYYKSLDHRSLTWRTIDKRAISTRTLISEIKDRAENSGRESAAAIKAKMDKAKEEHGTFYEVTMKSQVSKNLDLTLLPKPDRRLFTPHMSIMYKDNGWVQRDAYRILSFALERGNIPPADKERCHRLWSDFLGPWFRLSLNWMQLPAVAFQENSTPVANTEASAIVSNAGDSGDDDDEDESLDEDRIAGKVVTEDARGQDLADGKQSSALYMDHHPIPPGATVSTVYGEGKVIMCRRTDDMYAVKVAFGIAYLRPSAVLCTILPAEKSAYTSQLRESDRTKLERSSDMLAIGTQNLYLFFRLHQILVCRLGVARELAFNVKDDGSLKTLVEQMPGNDAAALGRKRYDAYLSLLYALIDGGAFSGGAAEGGKYEDRVRNLLGHGGYELATMDKLISHILKNLQTMANDDTMWNLVQLFRRHLSSGSFKPESFRQEAAYLSDGEHMYAFQLCPVANDGGEKSVLHMEYLGNIAESDDDASSSGSIAPSEPSAPKRQKRERQ